MGYRGLLMYISLLYSLLEEYPVHALDSNLFLVKVEKALKGGPQFKILSGIPHPPWKIFSPS